MELWSQWWVWGILAAALVVGEVIVPAYVLLGFGVGAGIMALLLLIGLPISASLPILLVVYASVSVVSWLVLRRFMGVSRGQVKSIDYDIND